MWKIVGDLEVSVIYIYIYIYRLCYGHHNLGSKRKEVYIDLLTKIMGFNAKQT